MYLNRVSEVCYALTEPVFAKDYSGRSKARWQINVPRHPDKGYYLFDVYAMGGLADLAAQIVKPDLLIYLEGKLTSKVMTEQGVTYTKVEILAEKVLCASKPFVKSHEREYDPPSKPMTHQQANELNRKLNTLFGMGSANDDS